jgi:hypothetical protein
MNDSLGSIGNCNDCGNPVLGYLCNSSLLDYRPESSKSDYWASCANLLCKNHYGEDYLFDIPEWVNK